MYFHKETLVPFHQKDFWRASIRETILFCNSKHELKIVLSNKKKNISLPPNLITVNTLAISVVIKTLTLHLSGGGRGKYKQEIIIPKKYNKARFLKAPSSLWEEELSPLFFSKGFYRFQVERVSAKLGMFPNSTDGGGVGIMAQHSGAWVPWGVIWILSELHFRNNMGSSYLASHFLHISQMILICWISLGLLKLLE